KEYGSTTGRPRRCGWLDLVALKYAVMLNGVTELIMMKADVLDEFETIKICTGYEIDGETVDYFPFELNDSVKPVYVELPGWKTNLTGIKSAGEFPPELNSYITFIEEQMNIPVSIASVGPNREQTIFLKKE
ncbi:MAG: adenylosuccinate synthetase, partial [Prolixibacteraceae bacterium]|nr:adenylosuccinate synthetase [Prolixibacteraceae bacterium]